MRWYAQSSGGYAYFTAERFPRSHFLHSASCKKQYKTTIDASNLSFSDTAHDISFSTAHIFFDSLFLAQF